MYFIRETLLYLLDEEKNNYIIFTQRKGIGCCKPNDINPKKFYVLQKSLQFLKQLYSFKDLNEIGNQIEDDPKR